MKHNKTALGHLGKHYERGKDESSEYVKFGNPQINPQKTHLNYNLAPKHNYMEFIKKRLSEVYCLNRKDVNVMCSWVITAPKDLESKQQDDFFKESYKFLEKRYGKENVVSSYVHLDETTPHMHFAFIPVVYDKKKNRYKVSAKERVNKFELKSFHMDYQEYLDKANIRCNVLNEATKEGNKSIDELKRGTAINKLNELEIKIKALEGALINFKDISSIIPKKTFTGAIRGVTIDDIEKMKQTILDLKVYESKKDVIDKEYEKFFKEKEIYKDELKNKFKNELENLKQENIELKNKNNELKQLKKDYKDLNKSYFNSVQENSYNLDLIFKLRKRIKELMPKEISQYEIEQMVKDHEEWINSNGLKGEQLNLEGKELNGLRLLNVDLEGANFKNTIIKDSAIFANLKNADFRGSKIENTEFLGSNLDNIKMDKDNLRIINKQINSDRELHEEGNSTLKTNQNKIKRKNIEYDMNL